MNNVEIIAHRGSVVGRPENTIPAFEHALGLGADGVECDVRMSRDGELFILHDPNLDRTTNGSGRASDRTFEELRRLDAGSSFDSTCAGARIPSLKDVLQWAGNRIHVLLDLKENGARFDQAVATEIRACGRAGQVIIGVRTPDQARSFREVLPECKQLAFMKSPELIEEFSTAGTEILRLWKDWLESTPALAARARETGKKLLVNGSSGNREEAEFLMRFRPDSILIDDVAQLTQSLAALSSSRE